MFWINGQVQEQIAVADRGLQYGDGCFTTARVLEGKVVWLALHMARLRQDAERLLIPFAAWDTLQAEMERAAQGVEQGVVKAIVTRGSGGRGYSTLSCGEPTRIVMQTGYPAHYIEWRKQGITLGISPVTLGRNPRLAGIKHLNRLEQILIRQEMDAQAVDDVVVLDTEGYLVECCAANLFWRKGCQVFTPDLSAAGVSGVARQQVMTRLAHCPDYQLQVVREPVTTLADADEVLVCNALMPVLPVNQIDTWCYRSRALYQLLSPNG
ncbi:aminodeoxychorismate lyase [Candidatus Symbiopectobacterium sp. NZEC127]|uniref:aminodeoxychorismate lyase n=1 Tax=Candidatus Symbiopectobacterium sp. NZEC127 TaxID=2820472 RepID=UPI0022277327|nr:aminodeoxychorismate lyase [Candidatus Symbiopectobacterium sp. NZEC127]MCW2485533.1 aminodeoxychorismate lyase [Candidatus Symbiopectobacterium sp. NZEC127]